MNAVGGPVRAAALIGKTRTHVDNMRKAGAPLRLDDVLVLARAAGVSLDWVVSGQVLRPDLQGMSDASTAGFEALPGFVRLAPLRPEIVSAGGRSVERWRPSGFAVSVEWLDGFGLTPDTARYAIAGDDGMAPAIGKGATVLVEGRAGPLRTGLYCVVIDDELLVRRLQRLPGGVNELVADADPRWRFVLSEEVEMYRVVWVAQAV